MKFDIKIISDTVCPWCYMGKRRLEAGIAAYKAAHPDSDDIFAISWYPYYLYPDAPATSIDKATRAYERFGEAKAKAMWENMARVGREVGIDFKFGGLTGHTKDSHRLIWLAGKKGSEVQNRVVNELFARYFEQEQDITDKSVLKIAAEAAGVDGEEAKAFLETDAGAREVDKEVAEAQKLGVRGVPNIRINGLFELPGALEADVFRQVFEKIASDSED